MWDVDGLSIEYNKYINDINNCRDQIENSKYTVLSCSNLQQADVAFNKIYSGYQNFLAKWKNETSISSNKSSKSSSKILPVNIVKDNNLPPDLIVVYKNMFIFFYIIYILLFDVS